MWWLAVVAILVFDAGFLAGCWWVTRERNEPPVFIPEPPRARVQDGPVLSDAECDLIWEEIMGPAPWRVDW